MTREKEIKLAALNYANCSEEWFDDKGYSGESTPYDDAHSFFAGAKWADETMINKVCAWLMEYGCDFATKEGLAAAFREAIIKSR